MTVPKVIVKNGKRYVKIGKKRIKVDSSLTERELIQWMIKHFKPKRRVKKSAVKDGWVAPAPSKAIVLPAMSVATMDMNRAQAREFKEQLEDTKKKLKESEDNFKKIAEDAKKAIEAPKRPAIEHKDDSDSSPKYTPEQIKQGIQMLKDRDAEIAREKAKGEQSKSEAERASKALRAERRKPLLESLERITKSLDALDKDIGSMSWNDFRAWASSRNISAGANPDRPKLELALTKEKERLAKDKQDTIAELEQIGEGRTAAATDIPAEGISDLDINRAMKDHKQFLGAIAADEIHSLKPGNQKRICWIQNTEPRSKGGAHWVAFFIDARPHGTMSAEYYDPLGDPITPGFLRDLKVMIKQVHGNDSYLKFRENKIPDQSDTSNNCGPFAIRFLQARLAGETFAKASGLDAASEKNIELWKKHPKQQTWISGQTGEGLRDIFASIRKGATKIYERVKATLSGPRGGAPPAVRGWLAKYGDVEIQNVWVCKKPIFSILESIGNWLSQGKLRENMDRLGYDRLMHLYMIVELKGGPTVKIEKEHVVSIKNSGDLGQKHMSTDHPSTVNAMIKQAEAAHGEQVWKYHLVDSNCQKFIMWCLGSKASAGVREFVMQNVEESLKDMGLLKKIATVVTDVAGAADVAINGAGHSK